jgi:quercetin dioxygenase-like cupin family protein
MADHLQEWARWRRVGRDLERNLVIDAEGLHLVRFKVAPGHTVPFHSHDGPQITVILSGTGVHQFTVDVHGKARTRRITTVLPVGPGDCYYIPPGTFHAFSTDSKEPLICIDIMVRSRGPTEPWPTVPTARGRPRRSVRPRARPRKK